MTTLPILPVVLPADIAHASNGRLDAMLLVNVTPYPGGVADQLHHLTAPAWAALVRTAARAGITLAFTSTYRTYDAQLGLFLNRYSSSFIAGRPSKQWNGKTWWLKPGQATAATPGASNHGFGIAVDMAEVVNGRMLASITPSTMQWLAVHAPEFGFSWELESEPWHVRYVAGDHVPTAVDAFLHPLPPPTTLGVIDLPLYIKGDGPGHGTSDPPTLTELQGNGWAVVDIAGGRKRWVPAAEGQVVTASKTPVATVPQALLDAMPWWPVT